MKTSKSRKTIAMIVLAILFIGMLLVLVLFGPGLGSAPMFNVATSIFALTVIDILYFSYLFDARADYAMNITFRMHMISTAFLMFISSCVWCIDGNDSLSLFEPALCFLYTLGICAEADLYFNFILGYFDAEKSKYKLLETGLVVLSILGVILTGIDCFTSIEIFNSEISSVFGTLPGSSIVNLSISCYSRLLVLWIVIRQDISQNEKTVLVLCQILSVTACIVELLLNKISLVGTVISICIVIFYSQISAKRSEEIVKKETELTNQKVSLMISQIQPHFVFNALNTICYLCRKDPKAAEKATSDFAQYLRMNIDSLSRQELIPFTKELDHVKIYVGLEQLRFKDKLNVIYEIAESDFKIPPLSLQPLVENAVKHGLCEKPGEGLLKLSTQKEGDNIVIKIMDNGVGFDQTKIVQNDDRVHVGIENVGERIRNICGGSLEIYSIPGTGTLATIKIPVEVK